MTSKPQVCRLMIVNRDPALADRVGHQLSRLSDPGYAFARFTHLPDALTYLQVSAADLVLVGPDPADRTQMEAIEAISSAHPASPVVALVAAGDASAELEARRAGAREVISCDEANPEIWIRTLEFCRREAAISQELATVTARLDWLVHMDSLTGLLNRKGMEKAVMKELARCRETDCELLILLIDLDEFSRINATLGHGVGDLVLVGASRRISEMVRETDRVGRCGTDRFVVMMPGTNPAQGEVIAENIRIGISKDVITAGEHTLTTTASLGLTTVSPTTLSFDEVLAKSHFVLQRSKLLGKNRVARAASLEEVNMIRPVAEGPDMIRSLLRGNILEVSSQPIVNLADGRITSREMLIRGPEGPLRRPDHLFRFCQDNDILPAVDLRCLKLCSGAARRMGEDTHYHVNIMPTTLLQTPVPELVRVLLNNGNTGECCLEISEQQLLGDPAPLVPKVKELQKAGVRIAMDDVGFGNSCLEGLIMLQPQVMKIDKRLIKGLAVDPELRASLVRLLKVADVLEAEVVAEGIETTEDYHILLDLGVRLGQGYLFGRPCLCSDDVQAREGSHALPGAAAQA